MGGSASAFLPTLRLHPGARGSCGNPAHPPSSVSAARVRTTEQLDGHPRRLRIPLRGDRGGTARAAQAYPSAGAGPSRRRGGGDCPPGTGHHHDRSDHDGDDRDHATAGRRRTLEALGGDPGDAARERQPAHRSGPYSATVRRPQAQGSAPPEGISLRGRSGPERQSVQSARAQGDARAHPSPHSCGP